MNPVLFFTDCGLSLMQAIGRVGNGVNTASGDWPWVVSISVGDYDSSTFICGGAILNPHTVITAAHCLEERNVPLLLRFGKHHFNVQDDDAQVLTRRVSSIANVLEMNDVKLISIKI